MAEVWREKVTEMKAKRQRYEDKETRAKRRRKRRQDYKAKRRLRKEHLGEEKTQANR